MSGIDNKVVSLTFDNASFQKKMEETLTSLDKLRASLNFSQGKESMGELQAAAGKFNMGGMSTAVDGVSAKFLALATVGITALASITSKAVDAGIQIAKSLTVAPLMQGFKEYETNMNSIQTILANTKSKGSTLDDVNKALDELNHYADKTIYNFAEMARNIGTFTAAGVDLETSTKSIKGIANLAAMSGSSSEQASTAMYQLSQAIAAGSLKLMDWNSVVNAGMGGEAFKTALFETGKAMGTLADVPMTQSFTEWENAGNSFRESLQDGWITSDVLTTTLGAISGDLDEAALSAQGFSDAQIVAMQDLAATATAAATEVKTASQLFDVIKESIGSGWAETFRIVVGNFTEAKTLFTGLNDFIGGFLSRSADARNDLLNGWKFFGGRDLLVGSLMNSLVAVKNILTPIRDAFREVFPPMTAARLVELTRGFNDFTKKLIISSDTAAKVKSVFSGIFSLFKIGVEIVKGIFSVFANLASIIFGFGGNVLSAGAGVGNFITKIQQLLVEGGGIQRFFDFINSGIDKLGSIIDTVKEKIANFFGGDKGLPGGDKFSSLIEGVTDKFSVFSTVGEKASGAFNFITKSFASGLEGIGNVLSSAWEKIKDFFSTLGTKIASVFTADAFAPAMDVFKVGLLGGIAGLLAAFFKNGLKLDFGQLGFLDSITGVFDELGGTLKAFQTQIKADALIRIATAVAILTASVLVLSFIDGKRLAASLGALAAGFAQLVASMAVLAKIEANPAKMVGLAGSMILMAGAALLLSFAVRSLAQLDWGELGRGLVGVTAALGAMAAASFIFNKVGGSFIRTSISLGVLSLALIIFSKAIKSFAKISYGDLGVGLIGIAGALGIFVAVTHLINPVSMIRISVGLGLLAISLMGMKLAVESFAGLDWGTILRGFVGIAGSLAILIGALHLMPGDVGVKALGLVAMAAALWVISKAIGSLGGLEIDTLVKGIVGMAAVLLILVVAANAMTGALVGAAAIVVMSAALLIMTKSIEALAQLSIGQILTGLLGLAGVLVILGLAAAALVAFPPLLGALIGMGAALLIIGAGFALLGAGAYLVAKALVELGNAGKKSIETLVEVLNTIIKAIPGFIQAFAEGLVSLVNTILEAVPQFIDGFKTIFIKLLDMIIETTPKIAEAFGTFIDAAVEMMLEKSPALIAAGITLLMNFLTGVRDNIYQITTLVIEIITEFTQSLADNIHLIMAAASNLMVAFIQGLLAHAINLVQAGVDLLVQFLSGISLNIGKVVEAVTNIVTTFITEIGNAASRIAQAGADALVDFIDGISNNMSKVVTAGANMIISLIYGIANNLGRVITAGKDATLKFLDGLVDNSIDFANKAGAMLVRFLNGLASAIRTYDDQIRAAGRNLAGAIIDGITGGLASKAGEVFSKMKDIAGGALDAAKGILGINSPSKEFYKIGQGVAEGFVNALDRDTSVARASGALANNATKSFNAAISNLASGLEGMNEFNPKITPVLDLSEITRDSKNIGSLINGSPLSTSLAYSSASQIARTTDMRANDVPTTPPVITKEVKFEQNNYSPKALSANDVYRNTRSQISMAKEELNIP